MTTREAKKVEALEEKLDSEMASLKTLQQQHMAKMEDLHQQYDTTVTTRFEAIESMLRKLTDLHTTPVTAANSGGYRVVGDDTNPRNTPLEAADGPVEKGRRTNAENQAGTEEEEQQRRPGKDVARHDGFGAEGFGSHAGWEPTAGGSGGRGSHGGGMDGGDLWEQRRFDDGPLGVGFVKGGGGTRPGVGGDQRDQPWATGRWPCGGGARPTGPASAWIAGTAAATAPAAVIEPG